MIRGPASFSANKQQEEVLGDSFSTYAQATSSTSKRLSMLKSSSFHIHPNLRSMCLRSDSRSLSRTISVTSPLSFIEEPLCAYLSLFDGTRKDLTGDELHIIDNLFSDEFVHIMDGVTPIDKPTFVHMIGIMLKQGIVATLEDINFVDEYSIEYTVSWYYKENSSRVTHVSALIADKKIVKLEPCAETRSAFANNMAFSSWKSSTGKKISTRRSSWWDLSLSRSDSGSGNSTSTPSSSQDPSYDTESAIVTPNMEQEEDEENVKTALDEKIIASSSTGVLKDLDRGKYNNYNTYVEAENISKSTSAFPIDNTIFPVKTQDLIDDNEEVVIGDHGMEGQNFVGVGVNHDKLAVETGQNNRSSIYLHLRHNPERRWFRVRGGKSRKSKGKQYEH